jgi:hypothetical protein
LTEVGCCQSLDGLNKRNQCRLRFYTQFRL